MSRKRKYKADKNKRQKPESVRREKFKNRFISFFNICIVVGLLFPLLFGGYALVKFIMTSDKFLVKNVIIQGNNKLSAEELKSLIEIEPETRIYSVDIDKIKEDIKSNSIIKYAVVRRKLPDTIVINLVERKPFAKFLYRRKAYEIDFEGVVIAEIDKNRENEKLPEIYGIYIIDGKVELGEKVESLKLEMALKCLEQVFVSDVSIYFNIVKINISNMQQIVLITDDNIKIQIGNDEIERKLSELAKVLAAKKKEIKSSSYIDLRFGNVVIRSARN
jgi:cell division protein FtsQ